MRYLSRAALIVFFASCAPVDVEPWHGDVTFTEAERRDIEKGAAWIGEKTGRPNDVRIVWDYEGETPSSHTFVKGSPAGFSGFCDASGGFWVGTHDELSFVTAHELGHCAFGFDEDVADHTGVMSSKKRSLVWSDFEQAQCVKNWKVCP